MGFPFELKSITLLYKTGMFWIVMMRNVGFHANFKVINNFQTSARGS